MPESNPHRQRRESRRFGHPEFETLARRRSKSPCSTRFCCCAWWFWPAPAVAGMTPTVDPHRQPPPSRISLSISLSPALSLSPSFSARRPCRSPSPSRLLAGRLRALLLSLFLSLRCGCRGWGFPPPWSGAPAREEEEGGFGPLFDCSPPFFFGCLITHSTKIASLTSQPPILTRSLNDLLSTIQSQMCQGSVLINLEPNSKVENLIVFRKRLNKSNND